MTAIAQDIRDRIEAAANKLYQELGRESFPAVDQVRRLARTDMNSTSLVMKEWRRQQTAQAAPVAVAVPDAVAQASSAALATLWQQAKELADESLRAAQRSWEAERAELDTMRQELATAFEVQAGELEVVGAKLVEALAAIQTKDSQIAAQALDQVAVREQVHLAEARIVEIERRERAAQSAAVSSEQSVQIQAAELAVLRQQLAGAGAELAGLKARLESDREAALEHKRQSAEAVQQAAERAQRIEVERDAARQEASIARQESSTAREEAARLRGQVEGMQATTDKLMVAIQQSPKTVAKPATKNKE